MSNKSILCNIRERTVKQFLDVLIVLSLKKTNNPGNITDMLDFFNKKFGVTIDQGSFFSLLFALERKGLIKGESREIEVVENRIARFYQLTPKGEELAKYFSTERMELMDFIRFMFES